MKNLYKIFSCLMLFFPMILLFSCTVQNKLNREYKGRNEVFLLEQLGKPVSSTPLPDGKKMEIFEKRTRLKKAPINTGQFQYDRFDSPEATKIESFKFLISSAGVVENIDYESRYER